MLNFLNTYLHFFLERKKERKGPKEVILGLSLENSLIDDINTQKNIFSFPREYIFIYLKMYLHFALYHGADMNIYNISISRTVFLKVWILRVRSRSDSHLTEFILCCMDEIMLCVMNITVLERK